MKLPRITACLLFSACAVLSLPLPLSAEPTPYPSDPAAFPGKGPIRVHPWFKDNRAFFWTMRDKKQKAIVFVGDSLIGNWKNLEKAYPGFRIANRGIGGDASRSLLFRFKEDVMDLHPTAIVILIGTNDLSAHATTADVLSNLSEILSIVDKDASGTPVILCTVPPRNSPKAPLRSTSDLLDLNKGILALAEGRKNVTILDLYTLLANPDGSPNPEYFSADLLHFGPAGYVKIQEAVQSKFSALGLQPAAPEPKAP